MIPCSDNKKGECIYNLIKELFPICRSITGNGVRQSLKILNKIFPLEMHEIPSGINVFDWKIPNEWIIRDAYIKDMYGNKIVDFKESNLHVINYSKPIKGLFSADELKKHIFTIPNNPFWIPYKTSYYYKEWGFCLPYNIFQTLDGAQYEAVIDSEFKNGSLSYGELILPGSSDKEFLLSSYICHPSMCNDNLSGPAMLIYLASILSKMPRNLTYRFLFVPETIGAIAWLATHQDELNKISHGLVVTCVGDRGNFTYKKSRQGNAEIDKIAEMVLKRSNKKHEILDFFPTGSDERQYCSPGFNLPVGSLMRTPYGRFPEYHTSADNLDFISADALEDSLMTYKEVVGIADANGRYLNLNPKCEPHLSKYGLYRQVGAGAQLPPDQTAILWVLNQSDGTKSLVDIASRSDVDFWEISKAASALESAGLLKKI